MRVLHLVEYLNLGGIERFLFNMACHDTQDVVIFAFEMGEIQGIAKELSERGIRLYLMKKAPGHDWKVAKMAKEICLKENIDVIHSHDFGAMEYAIETKLRLISKKKLRLIHTQHTLHHFLPRRLYVLAFNIFSFFYFKICCVGRNVLDAIKKNTFGINHKLLYLPNGVKIEGEVVPHCPELEGTSLPLQIIGVSRISKEKNIENTLKTLANLHIPFVYTHLGDGDEEYKKTIENMVFELGLKWGENIRFVGQKENVLEWLARSDLFLSSSFYEGLPISVLEAMSVGVPCVVSDIPAHQELKTSGVTLIEIDPYQFSQAINDFFQKLKTDPETVAFQKKELRETIKQKFSLELMIRRYEGLYLGEVKL